MTIEIVPVTQDNVEQAIALACQVFKKGDHYAIRQEFRAAVGLEPENTDVQDVMEIYRSGYVMALKDGVPAGFSGYYTQIGHEEDIWLGWTGVLGQFGRLGIGEMITEAAFKAAPTEGVKNLRIWTTDEDQYASARRLYQRMGFIEERYSRTAKPWESLSIARVFTKSAEPENALRNAWANSAYRLPDLELFDQPRMNEVVRERSEEGTTRRYAVG